VPGINIFRITQQYAYPTATVAMRVPFTYTYLCQFITRLKTAKFPGIVIDVVVKSKEGREIYAIRYTDRKNHVLDQAAIQTILIYARELSNVKYHMLKNDGTETSIPGTDKYLVTVPILYLREPQSAIPIYKRGFGLKRDWQQEMVFLYTKYYKVEVFETTVIADAALCLVNTTNAIKATYAHELGHCICMDADNEDAGDIHNKNCYMWKQCANHLPTLYCIPCSSQITDDDTITYSTNVLPSYIRGESYALLFTAKY